MLGKSLRTKTTSWFFSWQSLYGNALITLISISWHSEHDIRDKNVGLAAETLLDRAEDAKYGLHVNDQQTHSIYTPAWN